MNPVATSPLADNLATAPSGLVNSITLTDFTSAFIYVVVQFRLFTVSTDLPFQIKWYDDKLLFYKKLRSRTNAVSQKFTRFISYLPNGANMLILSYAWKVLKADKIITYYFIICFAINR